MLRERRKGAAPGSGIAERAIGSQLPLFTALFALAPTGGWIAPLNEMVGDPEYKTGRPRQLFGGATQRNLTPLRRRS